MDCFSISNIVLFLTFLAILWYSWETHGLKIQSIRQIELSLRPLVLIDFDGIRERYVIRNVGNGLALDIQIDDIPIVAEVGIIYSFKKIDLLAANTFDRIKILIGEKYATGSALGAIMPSSAVRDLNYSIGYTDMDGTRYQSTGQIGKCRAIFLNTKRISSAKRFSK